MKLRLALALAVVLAGSAIAADRVAPASPPRPPSVYAAPAAGVLSCPYLTESGAAAYIELANVGAAPAEARIGIVTGKGAPLTMPIALAGGHTVGVRVPASVPAGSSAVIEYSGGPLVASHMLFVPGASVPIARPGGAAAASCGRAGGSDVAVAGASTFDSEANLALFNPGSADADVTVTLIADGRVIESLRLAQRIVPAHARRDFRLGDFAFNARALTAVVHANVGRVVAEVLQRTGQGVELLAGQVPSSRAVAIAGQSGGPSSVGLVTIGPDDSGVDARLISTDQQTSVSGIPPDLPPASTRGLQIPQRGGGGPAAYLFDVTVGSAVVAATTWASPIRAPKEIASLPAGAPAARWGAVVGAFQPRTETHAVIVNPGEQPSQVHVMTIGPAGVLTRDITVQAGRLTDVVVGRGAGTFALLVDADAPIVLALRSIALAGGSPPSSVAVLGQAFSPPAPEAVVIDPRTGVPALVPMS